MELKMENQDKTKISDECRPPHLSATDEVCWPGENKDLLKTYTAHFEFTDLGCIIQIGCKKFCFSDNIVALNEFSKYVKNPKEAYETWNK